MKKMIVKGSQKLSGEVTIGGAKNSTVALIPASILADTPVEFDSVPDILDVHNLMLILKSMNVNFITEENLPLIQQRSNPLHYPVELFVVCELLIILWALCLENSVRL